MNSEAIKKEILNKISDDTSIDASKIGVIVENGVVTLTGRLHSMDACARVDAIVSNVMGVRAIAQNIHHDPTHDDSPLDDDIASTILQEFERETMIPEDLVQIHVQRGTVAAKGNVSSLSQKQAVSQVLKSIPGIVDWVNQIQIVEPEDDRELRKHVMSVIEKLKNFDSSRIKVECNSGIVTLTGHISPSAETSNLLHAIKSIVGVHTVRDNLKFNNETRV